MKVEIEKSANKSLDKINQRDRKKLQELVRDLRTCSTLADITHHGKLKGYTDRYKIRQGDYRIVYKVESPTHITITAIADRKEIYRRLFSITLSL